MPLKKDGQHENVDLSSLPPWFPINCLLKFDGKKDRNDKLID